MNADNENQRLQYTDDSEKNDVTENADLTVQADTAQKKNESRNKIILYAIAAVGMLGVGQVGYNMFLGGADNTAQTAQMVKPPTTSSMQNTNNDGSGSQQTNIVLPPTDPSNPPVGALSAASGMGAQNSLTPSAASVDMNNPMTSNMGGNSTTTVNQPTTSLTAQQMAAPAMSNASTPTPAASSAVPAPQVTQTTVAMGASMSPAPMIASTPVADIPAVVTSAPDNGKKKKGKNKNTTAETVPTTTVKAEECVPPKKETKPSVVHKLSHPQRKGSSTPKEEVKETGGDFFKRTSGLGGSISTSSNQSAKTTPVGTVVGVLQDRAWIDVKGRTYSVKTGDKLPDGNVVQKIDAKKYAVLTTSGEIR